MPFEKCILRLQPGRADSWRAVVWSRPQYTQAACIVSRTTGSLTLAAEKRGKSQFFHRNSSRPHREKHSTLPRLFPTTMTSGYGFLNNGHFIRAEQKEGKISCYLINVSARIVLNKFLADYYWKSFVGGSILSVSITILNIAGVCYSYVLFIWNVISTLDILKSNCNFLRICNWRK